MTRTGPNPPRRNGGKRTGQQRVPEHEARDAALRRRILAQVDSEFERPERRTVLLRLRVDHAGSLIAEPARRSFALARSSVDERLGRLARLVGGVFSSAREQLLPDEWALLMGMRPGQSDGAILAARFELLVRVLHRGSPLVASSGLTFKQLRHHGRLITLPDGMPFTVQLLFPDGRGKAREASTNPFQSLPLALQLKLIRESWDAGRGDGRACKLVNLLKRASKKAADVVRDSDVELTGAVVEKVRDRLRERLQFHDREPLYEKLGKVRARPPAGGR
jgi:hypothetical protein